MNLTHSRYLETLARLNRNAKRQPVPTEGVKREADLHDDIIAECRRRGWLYWHSRMDRRSTSTVGMPDFVILGQSELGSFGPVNETGLAPVFGPAVWFVEVKTRLGKLTTAQQSNRAHAAKLGHKIHVVRTMGEFMEAVK